MNGITFTSQEFMLIRDLLNKSKDIEKMSAGEYYALQSLRTKFNLPSLELASRQAGKPASKKGDSHVEL